MMRLPLSIAAAALIAAAQAQQTQPAQPTQSTPAQQTQAAPAPPAQSPVPTAGEITVTGSVDVGYRWRTDIGGSLETYRSIVNLGAGPKLLGTDLTIADPNGRYFDTIHVRAYNWGDDPYSSLHIDARKAKLYDFTADYRDIAYYNNLPSYADPLLSRGIVLDEQSFDTHRRLAHFELTMLPGNWIVPYAAYDLETNGGTGVSTLVTNGNQFPVPALFNSRTVDFHGGVRFELKRFHATLEQGGTWFRDDQTLYQNGGINYGNSYTPVLGQTLYLTDLLAAYGAHGAGIYTRGLLTANPAPWVDFYGQFLYSQPNSTVNYQQYNNGNLYLQSQVLFYTGQQALISSAAQMPHTSATAGAEIRPWRRWRITPFWLTDRMHNASSSSQNQTYLSPPNQSLLLAQLLASSLATNYNQAEAMVFFDAAAKLTLHGGYRYVWGDANDVTLPPAGLAYSDHAHLRRNVAIGGFVYRPLNKASLTAEAEGAWSGGVYFRTSLYNYQKVRSQFRYQATGELSFSVDFGLLNNQDPQPGIHYDYLSHQESLSVLWSPEGGKRFDLQGSYSRVDLRSNIDYLDPGTLQPQPSDYRENSHIATALFHMHLPTYRSVAPQLTAGGSLVITSGSRPTNYYQPMVKVMVPAGKHVDWYAEWRYYGYGEAFYLYEGFRTNMGVIGVRYTR
jgi:hypothetical protein